MLGLLVELSAQLQALADFAHGADRVRRLFCEIMQLRYFFCFTNCSILHLISRNACPRVTGEPLQWNLGRRVARG